MKDKKYTICVSPYNFQPEVVEKLKLPDKIIVYDTTLRDGEQMPGVSFDCEQKLALARKMDELGVHQIEAGFPVVSQEETKTVKKIANDGLEADMSLVGLDWLVKQLSTENSGCRTSQERRQVMD